MNNEPPRCSSHAPQQLHAHSFPFTNPGFGENLLITDRIAQNNNGPDFPWFEKYHFTVKRCSTPKMLTTNHKLRRFVTQTKSLEATVGRALSPVEPGLG